MAMHSHVGIVVNQKCDVLTEAKRRENLRVRAETGRNVEALAMHGGPGGIRTHGVLSEADYESAACNQHGVRPKKKKTRSQGRA
jgi:hypothetical protein